MKDTMILLTIIVIGILIIFSNFTFLDVLAGDSLDSSLVQRNATTISTGFMGNDSATVTSKDNETTFQDTGISIWTSRPNYVVGQQVPIGYKIYGSSLPSHATVNFEITKDNEVYSNITASLPKNKLENLVYFSTYASGVYTITAGINSVGNIQTAQASFIVESIFLTPPAIFSYIAIAFLSGLVAIILKEPRNIYRSEILRFVCISGIIVSILFSLLLTDLQIGTFAPIGLVEQIDQGLNSTQWVINIGGTPEGNFDLGIQIPIYVIIFGLVGGYLRYLYKTAKLRTLHRPIREMYVFSWEDVPGTDSSKLKTFLTDKLDIDWLGPLEFTKSGNTLSITNGLHNLVIELKGNVANVTLDDKSNTYVFTARKEGNKTSIFQTISWRSWVFYQSIEDLSLVFLAPLLSVALWFLLTQAGTTAVHTLALASLTVGLVTDEIIRAMLHFIGSILGNLNQQKDSTKTKGSMPEGAEAKT